MRITTWRTISCLILAAATVPATADTSAIEVLDSNRDGLINPYEALDALIALDDEDTGELTKARLQQLAIERIEEDLAEAADFLQQLDRDGNGVVELAELDEDTRDFAGAFDGDGDKAISVEEFVAAMSDDAILSSEEEIQSRLNAEFAALDGNKDGQIELSSEATAEQRDSYREWDGNRDGSVTRGEAYAYVKADNTPVRFEVEGETAYMTGVITSELPAAVLELIFEHPKVKTIEMRIVPGSIDDEANLRAALYVRHFGLSTRLNKNSAIASGGTDFFLAGVRRTVVDGATIGVHSWGGFGLDGAEVAEDDPAHQLYIDYYTELGIPKEFYWYTMRAAPANDIHIMTDDEISRYKVRTSAVE